MLIKLPFGNRIATARDVGNYSAGFIAGSYGLTWGATRVIFDRVQGEFKTTQPEPNVSTMAQYLGYH